MTQSIGAATATFAPAAATAAFPVAGAVGSGFDEELRRLLRSRLILVHLLDLAYVVLLEVMFFLTSADAQAVREKVPVLLVIPLAQSLIGAIVLWWCPGMSFRSLRLWELIHFGSHAALYGLLRFAAMSAAAARDASDVDISFRAAVTLFFFLPLILAYGVLIPNTWRRNILVVIGLAAVPFVALVAAAAANPIQLGPPLPKLVFQTAANLLFPAAIAVFAASRAAALHRRAFEAERRAEQVGQYALKRRLGEGGMGEVWLAEHRLLKRPCAVKFVRPELSADPRTAARFAREVQAVTGLTHFNTVRVYDYGRADDGSFYYVMEYLDGPTLETLVREAGPLPPGRAVYLLRQLCGALAEAHAAGLVHRDIKPGNVIVAALGGQRDVAKLLDFGLVHDLSDSADDRLTRAGMILGTPAYMPPEQAAGDVATDARGDVYSLGVVAFFALTGRPPFQGKTAGQLLAAHRSETPPTLTEIRPDIPSDLAGVVARCLAKSPDERFVSAAALDRALAGCRCAADWSAERAAEWWATADVGKPVASEPTRTFA